MQQSLLSEWNRLMDYVSIASLGGEDQVVSTVREISARLRAPRIALGMRQTALCRRVGIETNAWNNYEKARNRIAVDHALKLKKVLGVTLDWIYDGDLSKMPHDLVEKLQNPPVENSRRAKR